MRLWLWQKERECKVQGRWQPSCGEAHLERRAGVFREMGVKSSERTTPVSCLALDFVGLGECWRVGKRLRRRGECHQWAGKQCRKDAQAKNSCAWTCQDLSRRADEGDRRA